MKSATPLPILFPRQLMQACQELANTVVSFSGKKEERVLKISLGKSSVYDFIYVGDKVSDISLNLI